MAFGKIGETTYRSPRLDSHDKSPITSLSTHYDSRMAKIVWYSKGPGRAGLVLGTIGYHYKTRWNEKYTKEKKLGNILILME